MPRMTSIRRAFEFLQARARDRVPFSINDLCEAAGWTAGNTETNLKKRLSELVLAEGEHYCAAPEILGVRFKDFENLFRQKRRLFSDYGLRVTPSVLVYEFFMPLTHEDRLRRALDDLFYRDTVKRRMHEIGFDRIREDLHLGPSLTDEQTSEFVLSLVEETICGYSLYHVSGRFRMDCLASHEDVGRRRPTEVPYLMDETTAVVRFILPVDVEDDAPVQMSLFEPAQVTLHPAQRAQQLRWLFLNLFAEALARVVHSEDEIWLLESGMRSALYRWVRRGE